MTKREAIALSKRTEFWLRNHSCKWCSATLLQSLMHGCGAIFEKCDPSEKDFSDTARAD